MRQRKNTSTLVSITRNKDEGIAITEGLNNIKVNECITPNDVVVITPNWVNHNNPDPSDAGVVGQKSLQTIIRYIKQFTPKRIIVATGSGGSNTLDVMENVEYDQVIKQECIEFIDLNSGPFLDISLHHPRPSSTKINSIINEMTVLISFTQLKHHEESTMSACIKNIALGWPPAEVHGYPKKTLGIHDDLHGFIAAMSEKIPIDISILSCNPTMIGTGPSKGISRHTELVVCGTDAVAVDTIGARFLGFKPQAIHYLFKCGKLNIGKNELNQMNILGIDVKTAEEIFSNAVYGEIIAID